MQLHFNIYSCQVAYHVLVLFVFLGGLSSPCWGCPAHELSSPWWGCPAHGGAVQPMWWWWGCPAQWEIVCPLPAHNLGLSSPWQGSQWEQPFSSGASFGSPQQPCFVHLIFFRFFPFFFSLWAFFSLPTFSLPSSPCPSSPCSSSSGGGTMTWLSSFGSSLQPAAQSSGSAAPLLSLHPAHFPSLGHCFHGTGASLFWQQGYQNQEGLWRKLSSLKPFKTCVESKRLSSLSTFLPAGLQRLSSLPRQNWSNSFLLTSHHHHPARCTLSGKGETEAWIFARPSREASQLECHLCSLKRFGLSSPWKIHSHMSSSGWGAWICFALLNGAKHGISALNSKGASLPPRHWLPASCSGPWNHPLPSWKLQTAILASCTLRLGMPWPSALPMLPCASQPCPCCTPWPAPKLLGQNSEF